MKKLILIHILLLVFIVCFSEKSGIQIPQIFAKQKQLRWYKGNTHTHTINSDGDSTPDEVVRWYRENGYNFLFLTDHNFLTKTEGLNSIFSAEEKFLVIPGEEITNKFGDKPLHINGLNVQSLVRQQTGNSITEILQNSVNVIREAKGVPHINHPNFVWSITAEDLKKVENYKLLEIFNGHPLSNNFGAGDSPGLEKMWDSILSGGKLVYGIAVDDAHNFKPTTDPTASFPGKGWIVVRAENLSADSILSALEKGDFYASTGIELRDYQVTDKNITITINEVKTSKYDVYFIGKDGKTLSQVSTNPAVYQFRGDEMYVRAKIVDSNGKIAWTQPVMFGGK